jgi:N-acetylmuramic acid 6-phosphate etherase
MVLGLVAGGFDTLTRAVEGAEDRASSGEDDLRRVQASGADVVLGIAASGRTPYVLGALEYAARVGAFRIGLTCNPNAPIAQYADLTIEAIVGPEVIAGSTRLKAGTATKMILNMVTTGAMIRLGKTYGHLMVDLQATNAKLAARSRAIVQALTDLDDRQAAQCLSDCGGDVKVAIVSARRHVAPDRAREILAHANGHLRRALESAP